MSEAIQNRYEFVYFFDCENGNPNGDPDAGNLPRVDPETSHGLVTDVCLKRKIRNYVEIVKQQESPFRIYVREKAVLSMVRGEAYEGVDQKGKDKAAQVRQARDFMCKNFFDVRSFGAVMSTKLNNCGQVRGPVQLNFSRSVDPVVPLEFSITRMAVETQREAEAQSGDNRTMGRKNLIPYGLYRGEGYVSAHLAEDTGFGPEDLELLWASLTNMFDHDHSAARGKMTARKLFVFKHDSALGNAPAHKLFDLVEAELKDPDKPPRSFGDYNLSVSQETPQGVELIEML